ncbi:hypothetical protein P8610_12840 [Fictibacillus sp. UD]|uniref:hypothetical protein n=1 Tax=Fictibacillus sp. UD TaxID=3038777 RepID=UPI003746DD08
MCNYIIEFKYKSSFNAGSKARDDVNYFLKDRGFELLEITLANNKIKKLYQLLTLKSKIKSIKNDSTVLIQYPYNNNNLYLQSILKVLKLKNVKTICLIHDLYSLRFNKGKTIVSKEINILNKFDVVIAHNDYMSKWLYSSGLKKTIINLELFDYQTEDFQIDSKVFDKNCIAIAGNLVKEKSGFIYKFNKQNLGETKINLYGNGFETKNSIENISYFGPKPPSKLPEEIKGGFGLIWDGPELNECVGHYGEYMKYNNPHKLSLYIAAGLPVIVWDKAAIAEFVRKNKIGIVVDSINQLDSIVNRIDQDSYTNLQKNVLKIKSRVNEGYYIKKAVTKSFDFFKDKNQK